MHKNGRIIEILSQHLPGGGQVRTFTDVTERRIADARIRHMAHHDMLTGLANRTLLNERLADLLRQPNVGEFGLLCLDLDGFKLVNDTLGHEAGDRLLRDVGRRLHSMVGDSTFLARTGGDEFAILCPRGAAAGGDRSFADVILTAMTEPIDIDGALFRLVGKCGPRVPSGRWNERRGIVPTCRYRDVSGQSAWPRVCGSVRSRDGPKPA